MGIDIDPPDKDWLIACITIEEDALRVKKYIENLKPINFDLIKSSAVGFSKIKQVQQIVDDGYTPIVLTSFMLYQFHEDLKNQFVSEINSFCLKNNGYWIRQEVDISDGMNNLKYEIFFNETKIIDLPDDKCTRWKWI